MNILKSISWKVVLACILVIFVNARRNVGAQQISDPELIGQATDIMNGFIKILARGPLSGILRSGDSQTSYLGSGYRLIYLSIPALVKNKLLPACTPKSSFDEGDIIWFPVLSDNGPWAELEITKRDGVWMAGQFIPGGMVSFILDSTQKYQGIIIAQGVVPMSSTILLRIPGLPITFVCGQDITGEEWIVPAMNSISFFGFEQHKPYSGHDAVELLLKVLEKKYGINVK